MNDEANRFLVDDDETIARIVRAAKTIAVLGIKPESRRGRPAHDVPAFLAARGLDVVPVPVYYPDIGEILGRPVVRRLADVGRSIDIVDVFRRSEDVPRHLPDMLAAHPRCVWLQSGIRNDDVARQLAAAGIEVVQDRCLMVELRRFL